MDQLKSFVNSKPFFVVVLISFLIIQGKQSDHYFKWVHPDRVNSANLLSIHTDGSGYYAYLPQWYIYNSEKEYSHLEYITNKYKTYSFISGVTFDYAKKQGTNKYFIGTAICSTPIFLINHGINKIIYGEGDGYSRSYQFCVALNALLYWLIGVFAIYKLLRGFEIKRFWILFFVALLTFGTSLNFYTVYFPSFSHVFSFSAISWFIYLTYKWSQNLNAKYFIGMMLTLGLIFSIRPTNLMIVLLIPFFFLDIKSLVQTIKYLMINQKKILLIGIVIFFFFVLFQFWNVYSQIGEFKFNLYNNEQFDFIKNPQIYNVLFGYKKGFFTYAPVMFLIFFGVILLLFKYRYKFIIWSIVAASFVYLTSSWWCWWYGGGLGMRPFVDIELFISLPIVYVLKENKSWLNFTLFSIALPFVWIYQIYQIQFNKIILHYDKMDKVNFWRIFLKTDMRFSWSAEFKDEKLPNSKVTFSELYYADFKEEKLSLNRCGLNNIHLKNQEFKDPKFVYVNRLKKYENKFGIQMNFKAKINKPESNPSIEVFYFKNGKEIKKANAYIGYRIPNLNQLTPIKLEFYPKLKHNQIDSICFVLGKGVSPITYNDFSIQIRTY